MIARLRILLPFNVFMRAASQLPVHDFQAGDLRIRIYPPYKSLFECTDLELDSPDALRVLNHKLAPLRPEHLWPARRIDPRFGGVRPSGLGRRDCPLACSTCGRRPRLPHGVSEDRSLLVGRQSNQARVIVARDTERRPHGGMHPKTRNGKRPTLEAAKRRRQTQTQPSWPRRTTLGIMRLPGSTWRPGHAAVLPLVQRGPSRRMTAS
jgi:hypothetical protein